MEQTHVDIHLRLGETDTKKALYIQEKTEDSLVQIARIGIRIYYEQIKNPTEQPTEQQN